MIENRTGGHATAPGGSSFRAERGQIEVDLRLARGQRVRGLEAVRGRVRVRRL
ncbi:hypothetical protein [Carbonactinospora thermoautotrophica]|uniref:hypothetical protein n=1 Tax=Carbonactinospora thermoautotrophica TaxID=1469144 RepID=UPI003DA96F80